jgi:hypothetical protein
MAAEGYIYCISNPSMPDILKIGMTERHVITRLKEANSSDTWRPPTPFVIEFAKKVSNVKDKEKTLHALLEQYTERVNPRREFFRVSVEEVRKFFDLMDGEYWVDSEHVDEDTCSEFSEVSDPKCSKIPRALKELEDYLGTPCVVISNDDD